MPDEDARPVDPNAPTESTADERTTVSGGSLGHDPKQIGPYRILEQIGEGGFGVVYLAEQKVPLRRRVALKLIKVGMDTRQVVARFEAERQALAMMDHPNVAKVFDAGATETGRPYFVMELVPGVSITKHCDGHRLTIEARLKLFTLVCDAVQHAHQKSVIHRDIKPSNILVSAVQGDGIPKVIDFGVAKAINQPLTEQTIFTGHGQLIGTPEYMSPEQVELTSQDIDTRSDVYSLGVLLYELLTGERPFPSETLRQGGLGKIQRIIREEDPPKPSTRLSDLGQAAVTNATTRRTDVGTLVRRLRGELDWIVMKALEKDRLRRYATASDFAADVHRCLNDEPVAAGPPSTTYRLEKLIRRHRVAVMGLVGMFAVLVVGVIGTTWGLLGAIEARDAEAGQRRVAEAVTNLMTDTLSATDPARHGADLSVRDLLDDATVRLDTLDFDDEGRVEAEVRMTLGQMYTRLGLFDPAESHFRRALDVRRSLLGDRHPEVARSWSRLASTLYREGRETEAEPAFRKAIDIYRESDEDVRADLAATLNELGELLWHVDRHEEAEAVIREGLDLRRERFGVSDLSVAHSLKNLALVLAARGDVARAETVVNEALSIARPLLGDDHSDVAGIKIAMVDLLRQQERLPEAESWARGVLASSRERFGSSHPEVAEATWHLAMTVWQQQRLEEAETLLRELWSINRSIYPGDSHQHWFVHKTELELGLVLAEQQRFAEAEGHLVAGYQGLERTAPEFNVRSAARQLVAFYDERGDADNAAKWRATLAELSPRQEGN